MKRSLVLLGVVVLLVAGCGGGGGKSSSSTSSQSGSKIKVGLVTALLGAGMRITLLEEHDTVPWLALPGLMTDAGGGEWRLTERPERLAASYTLRAVKGEGGADGR